MGGDIFPGGGESVSKNGSKEGDTFWLYFWKGLEEGKEGGQKIAKKNSFQNKIRAISLLRKPQKSERRFSNIVFFRFVVRTFFEGLKVLNVEDLSALGEGICF